MVSSATPSPGGAQTHDGNLQSRLDDVVDNAITSDTIVGTVTVVAKGGEIAYRRAAGLADREAKTPMAADTIFRLSSLSKPIVSTAALAMIEAGRFGLDDPVKEWIPEFRPKLGDGSEPVITVRHLMTHTAGLTYGFLQPADGPYNAANVSDGLDQPGLTMEENLGRVVSVPLSYEPGASWGYSIATDVLGEVLARADDRSLPDVVGAYVTGPLGMRDTGFDVRDRDRLAVAYTGGDLKPARMTETQLVPFFGNSISFAPDRIFDPKSFPSGGCGMAGTAPDFLSLLEILRAGGGTLLSADTVRELSSNQIGDIFVPIAGPGWGFGLTSVVLMDPAAAETPQSVGTLRWGGVYGHSWFVDPAQGLVVIVLTNTAIAGMRGDFPDAIRDAVYAA